MDARERRARIRRLIETNGRASVEEVSYQFGVSLRTARRDLNILVEEGRARRVYGGAAALSVPARLPSRDEETLPVFARARHNTAYKDAIGRAAAALIPPGAHVIIDAGTTALYVARHIPPEMNGTVLTNGLLAANELAPRQRPRLHVAGGTCRPETYSLVGPEAIAAFRDVNADVCYIGTSGVDLQRGLTTSDVMEAEVKKAMMRAARQVILVADYAKFGRVSLYRFGTLRDVHVVVTDGRMPPADVARIRRLGPRVVVAD